MRGTLDFQKQVHFILIQLILLQRQNHIILPEYDFILENVFTIFVHIVQNAILFLNQ